ncbi:pilus assembly PilX family protein [Simplicispira psychrophila]|uniref:pilus assembly PilX family protein n=1 Tax=Simplicispira psychrophila TaxID=80882 RepID=UPI0004863916|nr:pilus assembly protein [Simplicispira psychrophila]
MPRKPITRHPRQRGVALFVVIVFVMLSMLLALWASRTSLFNEMLVGNDADYQRAFEATQALLQDAELDIRNENPDGSFCIGNKCRNNISTAKKIPLDAQEVTPLLADLDTATTKCHSGLCIKRTGRQDFWNKKDSTGLLTGEVKLADMTKPGIGARYGEYTGATLGDAANPANPILADRSANDRGGWYWIEVMRYDESSKNSGLIIESTPPPNTPPPNLLSLNLKPNVVYRITALAYGRKTGTMAVLQQTYARQVRKN